MFTDRVKQLNFKIYAFSPERFIRFSGHLILIIRAITWNIVKDGGKRRRLQKYVILLFIAVLEEGERLAHQAAQLEKSSDLVRSG